MHDLIAALEGWKVGQGDTSWRDEALVKELKPDLEQFKTLPLEEFKALLRRKKES